LLDHRRISGDVSIEFLNPKFSVRLGRRRDTAAFVSVPKAAVDEDDRTIFRENDVGLPGQAPSMDSKPKA
jgi:hypothetical protein